MAGREDTARVEFRELGWAQGYRFGGDGSIWSCRLRGGNDRGGNRFGVEWRELKQTPRSGGYLTVKLGLGGKSRQFDAHRLICEAFHGAPSPGFEACHDPDHDPANNRADNLRWGTSAENKADAERHGRRAKGAGHGRSKLRVRDIPVIRRMVEGGLPKVEVARKFGVDPATIAGIASGKNWSHVPG